MPQFAGRVAKGRVAKGSKSEREAVCLDTGRKRYILRRKEGNAVHDEELEKLVGKKNSRGWQRHRWWNNSDAGAVIGYGVAPQTYEHIS
jgi:hypothetical protein